MYALCPPAHLLEHTLSRIELGTVRQLYYRWQSHYLFSDRFGRPGKGNDKEKVEGMVGYTRRNFLVPVPSFDSFDVLNSHPGGAMS